MERSKSDSIVNLHEFKEWHPEGMEGDHCFDVGEIHYGLDGKLSVNLKDMNSQIKWQFAFLSPLAIRIVGEGSLMDYWNSGLVVKRHNVLVASSSPFLEWLEKSSSGAHSVGRVIHYAIFSDDVCLEILSSEEPVLSISSS